MQHLIKILTIVNIIAFLSCSCSKEQDKENMDNLAELKRSNTNQPAQKLIEPETKNIKTYKIEIINKFTHDGDLFTQGLFWHKGFLYEGTGLNASSGIHKINLTNGKVLKSKYNMPNIFGEGIALHKNKIYQLTWQNEKCFVYDINTFDKVDEFQYSGEGWGITNLDQNLIMSDGSHILKVVDPESFKVIKSIIVTDNKNLPVSNLNELENINGDIWANIWMTDKIAIIDAITGKIKSYIDLSILQSYLNKNRHYDVLNGIAYDKESNRIFVTGKLWEFLFEIKLIDN
jgi:glutamine cyclotransferase